MCKNGLEVWKAIPDYPGYDVSDQGRVRSYWYKTVPTGQGYQPGWRIGDAPRKFLKPSLTKDGYPYVGLTFLGKRKFIRVHQLVLSTFIGPCPVGMEGCHNDGIPKNVWLTNLRWDTPSNNALDRRRHGTALIGERAARSKLTPEQVKEIRRLSAAGHGQRALGRQFGVSHASIRYIIYRHGWTHV